MDSVGLEEVFVDWFSIVNRDFGGAWETVQGLAGQVVLGVLGTLCLLLTASHCCLSRADMGPHLHEYLGSFSLYFHKVYLHINFQLKSQGGPFGAHPDLLDWVQCATVCSRNPGCMRPKGPEGTGLALKVCGLGQEDG